MLLLISASRLDSAAGANSGKSGNISGRVTQDGEPVASANLVLLGTRMGGQTDSAGFFSIQVPAGRYTIKTQQVGCPPVSTQISLSEAGSETLHIELGCPRLHCLKLGKRHLMPDCFQPNSYVGAFIGRPCPIHTRTKLARDTVPVSGMASERESAERDSFPFAQTSVYLDTPMGVPFTEVAYCSECRLAQARWQVRMTKLHPKKH